MTRMGWWLLAIQGLLFVAMATLMLTAADRALDISLAIDAVNLSPLTN
jgi:hypothetical protein